ncbi:MAG: tetratricopeptide repeat protein [Candidatus Eremiobacteraeota bacterium]|nr:tetratricopeptide repeat protein [Candidatus Eremiobacteraeota bacterium]
MKLKYCIAGLIILVLIGMAGFLIFQEPARPARERVLISILKKDTYNQQARIELARLYIESGKYKNAGELLERTPPNSSTSAQKVETLVLLSRALSRELKFHTGDAGKFKPSESALAYLYRAEKILTSADDIPGNGKARLHLLLGEELDEQGQLDRASSHFNTVLKLSESGKLQLKARMPLLRNLIIEKKEKEAEKEETSFLKDIEHMSPQEKQGWLYLLGESYYMAGNFDKARKYLEQASGIDFLSSSLLQSHILISRMFSLKGDNTRALEELREVKKKLEEALGAPGLDGQSGDFVFGMVLETAQGFIFVTDEENRDPRIAHHLERLNMALKEGRYRDALRQIDKLLSLQEK